LLRDLEGGLHAAQFKPAADQLGVFLARVRLARVRRFLLAGLRRKAGRRAAAKENCERCETCRPSRRRLTMLYKKRHAGPFAATSKDERQLRDLNCHPTEESGAVEAKSAKLSISSRQKGSSMQI